MWLEGNGLPRIEGLDAQTQLRTLYLQENLIHKIENLDAQIHLDTLNLAQNQISKVENLGHMTELTVRLLFTPWFSISLTMLEIRVYP